MAFFSAFRGNKGKSLNFSPSLSPWKLTTLVVLLMVLVDNFSFFSRVLEIYPFFSGDTAFVISLTLVLSCVTLLLILPLCFRRTVKPTLILLLITASITAYFMDHYGVVIDATMMQNLFSTNSREALDLFHVKILVYLVFFGILPSYLVAKVKLADQPLKTELWAHLKLALTCFVLMLAALFSFSKHYASFFREHKPVRGYANPAFVVYSLGKYASESFKASASNKPDPNLDAMIPETDLDRELVIFVVGETARADRFSLNGYERETNPRLKEKEVYFFSDVHSCGTSTAVSVPCMFSILGRENYKKNANEPNVMDLLSHAGVQILWRDNNSDQRHVAKGAQYEDYRDPRINTVCDIECRDEGMLVGLDDFIQSHKEGDILIILHQMGNHGPAYYKRYPEEFQVFTPVCPSNQLERCSREEIDNTYDNAILYTDYFLSKTIEFLEPYSTEFETAMIYFSDHGESLGEHGIYLHGLPYFMAPETQTKVPVLMWFGDSFQLDRDALKNTLDKSYSHDNVFHTLLGLMEVVSPRYDPAQDMISGLEHDSDSVDP